MSSHHNPTQKTPQHVTFTRRSFLRYAGAGGGLLLLTACAAPAGTSNSGASGAAAGSGASAAGTGGEAVTMSFWTPGGSEPFCQGFNTMAADFMKSNPGITIEEAQCYAGQDSYNEVLLSAIAGGTPPDATVLWTSPAAFAVRNVLEPLDDFMATSQAAKVSDWGPGVLASCQVGGKTYGLPVTASTYGIYYNPNMLDAKGISSKPEDFPKTWDELRRLSAEFVVWNGDTLEQVGFLPWTDAVQTTIWSAANGTQIYDAANQKYTMDSEQNAEMFQFLVDWLDEQYRGDWVAVQSAANWGGAVDGQGRPPMFPGGKTLGMMDGFWYAGDFYTNDAAFDNWLVTGVPVGPSGSKEVSGYWPNWLVIPKGTDHAADMFKYFDYIAGQGVLTWYAVTPDLPASAAVPSIPAPASLVERRGQEFADATTAFFRKQLDIAAPMWNSPIQDFANDQLTRAAERILSKEAPVADVLAEANAACQAELDKVLKG
jgi:multiple sugar transport system substrate-binding protein